MTAPGSFDPRPAARAAARVGDWGRVHEILGDWAGIDGDSECAMLLAEALLRLRQLEPARAWLEHVIPMFELRADRGPLRRAVNMLGIACLELGDLDRAEAAHLRAMNLAQADGDDLLMARATNNLGIVANVRGQREQALANYQLAVPAYQRLGNAVGVSECYHNMAISYRDAHDLVQADEYAQRAIEFARESGNDRLLALARLGRAEIIYRRGDMELAGASARLVVAEFARQSDPMAEADARRISGLALFNEGKVAEARAEVERAVELAHGCGAVLAEAEATRALAEIHAARGDRAAAELEAARAVALFERLGATADVEDVMRFLEGLSRDHPR